MNKIQMDKTQLQHFLGCMIGWRSLGAAGDEEISTPVCPEMKSFLVGKLGDMAPRYLDDVMRNPEKCIALAALLRDAADMLNAIHAPVASP